MSLIPVFVFIGGVISSAPIVLFTVFVIELICFIKGLRESTSKAKQKKHLYGMIVSLALLVVIVIAAYIILRYV